MQVTVSNITEKSRFAINKGDGFFKNPKHYLEKIPILLYTYFGKSRARSKFEVKNKLFSALSRIFFFRNLTCLAITKKHDHKNKSSLSSNCGVISYILLVKLNGTF